MNKKTFKVVPIILAAFIVTLGLNKIRFRYDWVDAAKRTLLAPLTGTLWADGFSEAKFAKVKLGMSLAEVKALLGAPLREWCGPKGINEGCTWLYSWQDTPTADYDRRWVSFDALGRVEEIRHDFYID